MSLTPPVIILVEPQLVENIGTTARAMMNCGLYELRLVTPRDPWPLGEVHRQRMMAASSGADIILEKAKLFSSLEEALADLNYVYATTARTHDMVTRILTAKAAAPDMKIRAAEGQRVGVMFGRERTGLINEYIALANAKITIPLNPEHCSLNLAQAVMLVGYEWYQAQDEVRAQTPESFMHMGRAMPATRDDYMNFFRRLEGALDDGGFFVSNEMRPAIVRNIHNMFQRAELTDQEIRTLHGMVTALGDLAKKRNTKE